MPIEWNGDGTLADQFRIEHNLVVLLRELQISTQVRALPSTALAREWHHRIYDGVTPPVRYYVGGIRGSTNPNQPELANYEVGVPGPVGIIPAVRSSEVWVQLATFERMLQERVQALDLEFPLAQGPILDRADEVIALCAFAHGEWIRIHPFVNGNGRTARIWANWCALRYGLPAFVRLRPRPSSNTYETAAQQSMFGQHQTMEIEFWRLLTHRIQHGSTA